MSQVAHILKKFFSLKKTVNPRYSLRSLARDLDVNPSVVSRILTGKQDITPIRLEQFIEILNIDAIAAKELKRHLIISYMKELGLEESDLFGMPPVSVMDYDDRHLSIKDMNILNPWYNIAILEFSACEDFVKDPAWIAKRLGLRVDQVEKSLTYLLLNGFLVESEEGYRKSSRKLRLPMFKSHEVVRYFHKAMMELAVREMFQKTDDQSYASRLITSTSIAVNSAKLEESKAQIAKMQLEIAEMLNQEPCDEVYNLTIGLFPITVSK